MHRLLGLSFFFLLAMSGRDWSRAAALDTVISLGEKVSDIDSLRDLRGGLRPLQSFKDNKAIVLVFMGADCPISNLYIPTLNELEKKYRGKSVTFLAIYPLDTEGVDLVSGKAYDGDLSLLVLKDYGGVLARKTGVKRLPSGVVLDREFKVRYRGRIDDRYSPAIRKHQASRADLDEAIAEVCAGKEVSIRSTETDGCLLPALTSPKDIAGVSYRADIAPLLQKSCQCCHRIGQSAPFPLLNYEDARKHAGMIKEVTTQKRMPPWQADARFGHFLDDRHLNEHEIDLFRSWVNAGCPEGTDKSQPKEIDWPQGWSHGKPDLVLSMPEEFEVPAQGVLPYKNWIIETNFAEDKWVTISEARPGNAAVVHHIVAYIMKNGSMNPISADGYIAILVGWAPGDLGLVCPPDTALRLPKGCKIRLEMHYTPIGKKVKDRSAIALTFAKQKPKHELFISEFANMAFEIEPNNPHFKAEATFRLRADAHILSFAPHMHWRGKDYFYEVVYPDGKRQTLLSVPRWDFNWQNVYRFDKAIAVPKGAKLHSIAHWDNSKNNPYNPDPAQTVRFGLQTWEEMMVGFVAYVWDRPETAEELAKNPLSLPDLMFNRMDTNGDDWITPDEVPSRMKSLLKLSGMPLPEKANREEFTKIAEVMIKRFGPKKETPQKNKGP